MARKHPTLEYLRDSRRSAGKVDGGIKIPRIPGQLRRRQIFAGEYKVDWGVACYGIRHLTPANATFFIDTSFRAAKVPREFWDALRTRRILITPYIWQQWQPWFENPLGNLDFHADIKDAHAKGGTKSISFLNPRSDYSDEIRASVKYYIHLLASRKMVGFIHERIFEQDHGRKPTHDELLKLLQQSVHERGLVLAKKGMKEIGSATFLADEELVACAIAHALSSNCPCYIFSCDRDLSEIFYKAQYLIDTHYRAMVIADYIHSHPDESIWHTTECEFPATECFHPSHPISLVGPKTKLIPDSVIYPKDFTVVPVWCFRFADHKRDGFSVDLVAFGFEMAMRRIFELKGTSGGLNTSHFDGRNCHICVPPTFRKELAGCIVVARDQLVKPGYIPLELPIVDINYAWHQVERFVHVEYAKQDDLL